MDGILLAEAAGRLSGSRFSCAWLPAEATPKHHCRGQSTPVQNYAFESYEFI